ncbi:MAG: peptidoglycan-binding protein [Myxococcales bacterium]|nr:peptidoglycan-binding protein [Myxococcales bacterium]
MSPGPEDPSPQIATARGALVQEDIERPALWFGTTGTRMDDRFRDVSSGVDYPDPTLIASMQGFVGSNPAGLRSRSVGSGAFFQMLVEEEASRDSELTHLAEDVGYLLLSSAEPAVLDASGMQIGEHWKLTASQASATTWQTASTSRPYGIDALIFAHLTSYNGSSPAHIRIRGWDGQNFQFKIEEWRYLDGAHGSEEISFLVVEPGRHSLPGLVELQAGSVQTTDAWTSVTHSAAVAPVVFAQCQSFNGSDPVTTRITDLDASGFRVRVQEEEALGAHTHETVGWLALWPSPQAGLQSRYFGTDARALRVASGATYDVSAVQFTKNTDQNRDIFAYKILSALHMLGYNTQFNENPRDFVQSEALKKFQADHGLPQTSVLDAVTLRRIDAALAAAEPIFAAEAQSWLLRDKMSVLHGNMVSLDFVSALYGKAFAALPSYLQPDAYELLNCIATQCNGNVTDADGNPWSSWPIDLNEDFYVEAAYYGPREPTARFPAAMVNANAVLHEYAHYLDGSFRNPLPGRPLSGYILSQDYYAFSHDISPDPTQSNDTCLPRLTDDPANFITWYGFQVSECSPGRHSAVEEFAEGFSSYVTSGRQFRAAAAQNPVIAAKYQYLRDYVFNGREYDTEAVHDAESGCNDILGQEDAQPGYLSCDYQYVWDFQLPLLNAGQPLCMGACDDGAVCTAGDGCDRGRCEGTTIASCSVSQARVDGGVVADVYAQAQSFRAPASTLSRVELYIQQSANWGYSIRIVDALPIQSEQDSRRADSSDLRRRTVGTLHSTSNATGWVSFEPSDGVALNLRPGHLYYIYREIDPGTFGSMYSWALSPLGPDPGPYADGTGYFLHMSGWLDWAIKPESQNHWDYAFKLHVD